jgi:ABC-2 type transport system permease protein
MVVMGLGLGAMAQEVGDLVGTSDGMLDMLEQFGGRGSLVQVYLAATVAMAGIGAAAYTVQAALRVCSEESSGTLETVLSTSVGRPRWLMAHVVVAASGTVALLALEGAATGLTHGLAVDDPLGQVRAYAWAGLLQAPAALVLGGLAIMAFGVAPRRCRAIAWAAYALCIVLGQMGELFRLPDIVLQLSPFTHLPAVPVEPAAALPVAILCAAALGLTGVGVDRFRRRDVQVG